jgi:hypothetical protein
MSRLRRIRTALAACPVVAVSLLASACDDGPPMPTCGGGPTAPFTVQQVETALLRHGIRSAAPHSEPGCGVPHVVAVVSNYGLDFDRNGTLGCTVTREQLYGNGAFAQFSVLDGDERIHYAHVGNVECTFLQSAGGARGRNQVDRVLRAVRSLGRHVAP